MALRQVNVAEETTGGAESVREALLLYVHMIGIQMDKKIVQADPLNDLARIARAVQEVRLITVARLYSDREPVLACYSRRSLEQTADGTRFRLGAGLSACIAEGTVRHAG